MPFLDYTQSGQQRVFAVHMKHSCLGGILCALKVLVRKEYPQDLSFSLKPSENACEHLRFNTLNHPTVQMHMGDFLQVKA